MLRGSEAQARVADLALVVSNALPKHTVMKANLNDADRSPRNGNERLLFSSSCDLVLELQLGFKTGMEQLGSNLDELNRTYFAELLLLVPA